MIKPMKAQKPASSRISVLLSGHSGSLLRTEPPVLKPSERRLKDRFHVGCAVVYDLVFNACLSDAKKKGTYSDHRKRHGTDLPQTVRP
jgi:hypothetical protein